MKYITDFKQRSQCACVKAYPIALERGQILNTRKFVNPADCMQSKRLLRVSMSYCKGGGGG